MEILDGAPPKLSGEDQAIIAGLMDAVKWMLHGRPMTAKNSFDRAEKRFLKRYMPELAGDRQPGRAPRG